MPLEFQNDNRLFVEEANNMAKQLKFAVKDGLNVTESSPLGLTVEVASGTLIFNGTEVSVSDQQVAISAADPSLDRNDLIVIDATGTASAIAGIPAAVPKTPTYDPDTFVAVARVFVDDGATQITNADITDVKIINEGLAGAGGGLATFTQVFSSQTIVPVAHNLNDAQPLVQVFDSNGEQITPDKIDIIDADNANVEFSVATSGHITVHGGEFVNLGVTAFKKFGFSGVTSVTINHALGTRHIGITVYDNNNFVIEPQSIEAISDDEVTLTFGSATTGTVSLTGGSQNPSDGVGRFEQAFTSATQVTVNHNLNDAHPVVMVYDASEQQIFPDITVINNNVVQLDFASATTGNVIVVGGVFVGGTNAGNFVPSVDDAFDIGSGTFRWKDIHISGSLFLGLLSADPGFPAEGETWYNSTDKQFKGYDGTSVIILG